MLARTAFRLSLNAVSVAGSHASACEPGTFGLPKNTPLYSVIGKTRTMWVGILVILFGIVLFLLDVKSPASVSFGSAGLETVAWIAVVVFGIILLAI